MKTKILGQIITNKYSVDNKRKEIKNSDGNPKMIYGGKPELKKESEIKWADICEFEGDPRYNNKHLGWYFGRALNISEDEEVSVNEEIFRADLNELHLHTNKILKEIDLNKDEMEIALTNEMKSFNKEIIEADEKLKSYCLLHKLNPEETDCMELFKLVYSTDGCVVANGTLMGTTYSVIDSGTITINADNVTIYKNNVLRKGNLHD